MSFAKLVSNFFSFDFYNFIMSIKKSAFKMKIYIYF